MKKVFMAVLGILFAAVVSAQTYKGSSNQRSEDEQEQEKEEQNPGNSIPL